MIINTDGYKNNPSLVRLWCTLLLLSTCSYLPITLFIYYIFLDILVGVAFTFSLILSTSKTIESVLDFLEMGFSMVIIFLKYQCFIVYWYHLEYWLDCYFYHFCLLFSIMSFFSLFYEKELSYSWLGCSVS